MSYLIRKFMTQDRVAVRRLSCKTSFLELPREQIFKDDEILADVLTLYFTDYELESCFVAVDNATVIGYLIGSKDVAKMNRVINLKITPMLIAKMCRRRTLLYKTNIRFLFYCFLSFLKGEFFMQDFSKDFPAVLHINIDSAYRNQGIGKRLIETYISFLKQSKVKGVHFSTLSENAKGFFLKMGFDILCKKKRSYLKPFIGREVVLYVFGKRL